MAIVDSEDCIFSFHNNIMFHCTIHTGQNTGRLHFSMARLRGKVLGGVHE